MDEEGFAIVSSIRRLDYFVLNGVIIFTDHRNLAYIFKPQACVSFASNALVQRLESGEHYYLSVRIRSGTSQGNAMRGGVSQSLGPDSSHLDGSVGSARPSSPNDMLPSKEVVRVARQRALSQDGIRVSDAHSFETR